MKETHGRNNRLIVFWKTRVVDDGNKTKTIWFPTHDELKKSTNTKLERR